MPREKHIYTCTVGSLLWYTTAHYSANNLTFLISTIVTSHSICPVLCSYCRIYQHKSSKNIYTHTHTHTVYTHSIHIYVHIFGYSMDGGWNCENSVICKAIKINNDSFVGVTTGHGHNTNEQRLRPKQWECSEVNLRLDGIQSRHVHLE